MKKIIIKILIAATAFIVSLGFMGSPAYVHAEESAVTETPSIETSAEVPESSTEDGSNMPENSVQTPTINDSSTSEETPEVSDEDKNTEDLEHTFENFLIWAEQEANRYGYGDEYASALKAIKVAATQEQVTLSTVGSFLLMAATIAYTIYKKVTDKKFKTEVANLSQSLSDQLSKLNELVDGTNNNTKTEEEIKAEEQALKEETIKVKTALENLINGFMHFSSHVNMKDEYKTEVQRDCTKALKSIDGEVKANENHKV